ncbi:phage minor head protein [Thermovibrio ammonificans]
MPSKEEILRRIKELEKKLTELSQKYDSKVVKEFLDTWEKGLLRLESWIAKNYKEGMSVDDLVPLLSQIDFVLQELIVKPLADVTDDESLFNKRILPALQQSFREVITAYGLSMTNVVLSPEVAKAVYTSYKSSIMKATEDVKVTVSRVLTQATISPMSIDDIMRALKAEDGFFRGVTKHRLETVARSELHRAFRTAIEEVNKEKNYRYYKMVGPVDERTSAICRRYVGKIKTREEWLKISPYVFSYGLHPNCRHQWIPVPDYLAK